MRVVVINLDRAGDRLSFQTWQLARLGLAFERLPAVEATSLPPPPWPGYWDSWERPLSGAERACLMSHRAAWVIVAESGAPALILEDDAVLSRHVPEVLAALSGACGIDHVTLEVRGRKKLLSDRATRQAGPVALHRLWQDRTGAVAYVLFPSGARKLLARSARRAGLADAVICAAYEMVSLQCVPACAVQSDRCAAYGLTDPLRTVSAISTGPQADPSAGQRLRRIGAQVRMGLRQIACLGRAVRLDVPLRPGDFA